MCLTIVYTKFYFFICLHVCVHVHVLVHVLVLVRVCVKFSFCMNIRCGHYICDSQVYYEVVLNLQGPLAWERMGEIN
jgi:hypothetical protein